MITPSRGVTLAIAKGRILESTRGLFEKMDMPWPLVESSRQLWFPPTNEAPGIIIARTKDVPTLVHEGIADLGIVGFDVLRENPLPSLLEVCDLKIAPCRIVLAGQSLDWPEGPTKIATKYQHITQQFFAEKRLPIELVPLSGSLELAPIIGLAPYIVDIVDTGRTLREHQLVEITTIMTSTARLIANASHWRTKPHVHDLREKLRAII